MEESINETLLLRFLEKRTSTEENDTILRWVSDSEENRDNFRKLHHAYHSSKLHYLKSEIDIDKAWDKLNRLLPKAETKKKLIFPDFVWKVAASVLLIVAGGLGSLWVSGLLSDQTQSTVKELSTFKGEKSQLVLSDGSRVWLNSQTVLKYDESNPRNVTLDGEAFFEIEKDRTHPFEVITKSGMKVVVTGTKFNLRSYSHEPFVETTLEEGEVQIKKADSKLLVKLEPGQQAQYNVQTNAVNVQNVSSGLYSLWKNDELRFVDISFDELIPQIERWYGVTIKVGPKQKNDDRYTMTIKTESLQELLNMMQLTSKFSYEINKEEVKINF